MKARRSAAGLLLPALLLALSQTGCTALFPTMASTGEQQIAPQALGTCTVELRPELGSRKTVEVTVTQGMLLTDVAIESGAARKFRGIEGFILREGNEGQAYQLKGRWSHGEKCFTIDTDYSIQPGDRVMFVEDTATVFDGVISSLLGPLGSR